MRIHLEVAAAPDWAPLIPQDPRRMMGGTERLALQLAYQLAARGHEISFRGGGATGEHCGVRFAGPQGLRSTADAVIGVQCIPPPDVHAPCRIVWSHAAQWPAQGDWSAVVAVSPYHAELIQARLPGQRVQAIRPGLLMPPGDISAPRDRFLYASSPDRGLHRLLSIWPALWESFRTPLAIAYDVRGVLTRRAQQPGPLGERLRAIEPLLDQPGVLPEGMLSEEDMHRLRARCLAMLYPLEPVMPHSELLSLAVLEACAAGVPPILAPVDCFPSEYGQVARMVEEREPDYRPQAWIRAVEQVLEQREELAQRARAFAAERTVESFTDQWEVLLADAQGRPADRVPASGSQRWIVVTTGVDSGDLAPYRALLQAAADAGHRLEVFASSLTEAQALDGSWRVFTGADRKTLRRACAVGTDKLLLLGPGTRGLLQSLDDVLLDCAVVSLEPGWPEWMVGDAAAERIDLCLACLTPQVFRAGLEGLPPLFGLPRRILERLRCCGPLSAPGAGDDQDTTRATVHCHLGHAAERGHPAAEELFEALAELQAEKGIEVVLADWQDQPIPGQLDPGRTEIEPATTPAPRSGDVVIWGGQACNAAGGLGSVARVLLLTPGATIRSGTPTYSARWAQAHFLTGDAEYLPGVHPAATYRRRLASLLDAAPREGRTGTVETALRMIENACHRRAPRVWNPQELLA